MVRKRDRKKINEWYANRSAFKKWFGRAKYRYNLTEEEGLSLFDQTNCEICDIELTTGSKKSNAKAIDHCHETGKVRGAICRACNGALGLAKDNVEILIKMIKYLENE